MSALFVESLSSSHPCVVFSLLTSQTLNYLPKRIIPIFYIRVNYHCLKMFLLTLLHYTALLR